MLVGLETLPSPDTSKPCAWPYIGPQGCNGFPSAPLAPSYCWSYFSLKASLLYLEGTGAIFCLRALAPAAPPTTLFPHSALWLAASLSLSFCPLKTWDFGSGFVMLQSATLNSLYLGTRKVPLSHSLHCHVMACHGMVWGVLMAAQRPRRTQAPLLGFSRSQWQWEGTMARHTVILHLHSDLVPITIHWPKQVTRV